MKPNSPQVLVNLKDNQRLPNSYTKRLEFKSCQGSNMVGLIDFLKKIDTPF
jgi:hypothetical protein